MIVLVVALWSVVTWLNINDMTPARFYFWLLCTFLMAVEAIVVYIQYFSRRK